MDRATSRGPGKLDLFRMVDSGPQDFSPLSPFFRRGRGGGLTVVYLKCIGLYSESGVRWSRLSQDESEPFIEEL